MKTNIIKSINKREIIIIVITLIIGIFLGGLFFGNSKEDHKTHSHEEIVDSQETIYTCSMHPQIKQNKPGLCPICAMDLVPMTTLQSEDDDVDPNEIQMTESAIKLADIQTGIVKRGVPEKSVHLFGKIKADERNIAKLTARFGGRIEKLDINFTGQNVRKGQKLGTIYSPELITAQKELLEALKYKETNPSFYKASRSKLKLWDLTNEQIDAIENNGEPKLHFDILSPITGTVTNRYVAIGDYIKEGSALFEVIDLTNIWVIFDAYESDLPWINVNDNIDFTLQSVPGKLYSGKVAYIDPFINASTRVTQVRVNFGNPELLLKPEMFVNGVLESKIAENSTELLIPKSSILWTGKRAVVYVKIADRKNPSFLYREIILGPEAGDFYVVSEGLTEGEEIAINGVFKIDASAQLAGKPSMMNPEGGIISTGHNHGVEDRNASVETKDHSDHDMLNNRVFDVDTKFRNQLTQFYKDYLKVTEAFVSSDAGKVSASAKELNEKLKGIDMSLLEQNAHMLWMEYRETIYENIKLIIESKGIENQRVKFSELNLVLYKTIKAYKLDDTVTTYYQYCPMANGDKGAYWFSNIKEIRNPYFGDMMLKCGETREIIK